MPRSSYPRRALLPSEEEEQQSPAVRRGTRRVPTLRYAQLAMIKTLAEMTARVKRVPREHKRNGAQLYAAETGVGNKEATKWRDLSEDDKASWNAKAAEYNATARAKFESEIDEYREKGDGADLAAWIAEAITVLSEKAEDLKVSLERSGPGSGDA